MLPLTISIITHTMPGRSVSVMAKLFVQSPQREYVSAMTSPRTIAAAKRKRNCPAVSVPDERMPAKNEVVMPFFLRECFVLR